MQYVYEVILIAISLLLLQQQTYATNANTERAGRQAKVPNNAGESQASEKVLNGLVGNQPQILPSFGAGLPYGGRYGGVGYGGSGGYPSAPGMGLFGMQFVGGVASAFPGFNALQMGNPAGIGYPALGNYVGNNLPPYTINAPDVYAQPLPNGGTNLNNILNMASMLTITANDKQTSLLGAQIPLQGQAAQPQPQFVAGYPFTTTFYGPLNGYGAGFQNYQML